jgi:uncharacterized protein (TIGR02145 family)
MAERGVFGWPKEGFSDGRKRGFRMAERGGFGQTLFKHFNKEKVLMSITKSYLVGIAAAFFLAAITCTEDPVGPGPVNITGTVTDIDGNVYTTVKIGTQEWMAENLRTTRYNDSSEIPFVTKSSEWYRLPTPAYCYYNNTTNAASIKKFGALYNWYVVNPLNPYKIAPKGWRVPDTTDWNILQNYLIANGYNWDGTTSGNKIAKSMAATTDWKISTQAGAMIRRKHSTVSSTMATTATVFALLLWGKVAACPCGCCGILVDHFSICHIVGTD